MAEEKREELERRLAQQESINDHLVAEISQIDTWLHQLGFNGGWHGVKQAAEEIIERGGRNPFRE